MKTCLFLINCLKMQNKALWKCLYNDCLLQEVKKIDVYKLKYVNIISKKY